MIGKCGSRIHAGDDRDEDECLRRRRQRVADNHGARNLFVRNQSQHLVSRGRRGERADAERVKEICDEAHSDICEPRGTRCGPSVRISWPSRPCPDPPNGEEDTHRREHDQKHDSGVYHW
jgi:hypothetical protein